MKINILSRLRSMALAVSAAAAGFVSCTSVGYAEPDYDTIYEGQWRDSAYLAVHRVAVSVASRGTGVAAAIMEYAAVQAKSLGRTSLRIDTHKGNLPMRRMLEKQGFEYRGMIYLADGAHRVAYEKILQ